jgi:hypothetical protein
LTTAIDLEYPRIEKAQPPTDRKREAARRLHWRTFEHTEVNPGRTPWNRARADAFNVHYAHAIGREPKPIRFDYAPSRGYGRHSADAIRLAPHGGPGRSRAWTRELWRTLLHEIAHYRAHGHGRAFREELLNVYREWRTFMFQSHAQEPQE